MKPLYVLLGAFIIAMSAIRLLTGAYGYGMAGIIAMSVMLLFTAIGHFAFTRGMTMMMPEAIPWKRELVYLTGVLEIAGGAGLLIPAMRFITSWLLIAFLVAILPTNVNAAIRRVDYQKGTAEGPGPRYLWLRIPLQGLFIAWIYLFGIRLSP